MPSTRMVTTSWDDGDPWDIKVAALLRDRGLAGTFYVPIIGPSHRPVVSADHLRDLHSQGFEIGAHGTSHKTLPQLSDFDLTQDVRVCRMQLEDTLGEKVRMFCYPKGQYDARVIREVQRAGYEGARTTEMLGFGRAANPYKMSTTVHAFAHTKVAYLKNTVRAQHFRRAIGLALHRSEVNSWIELAKSTFDRIMQHGGVWHLYGHSWAIEKHSLWDGLIEVLDYVARREGFTYVTNCEVLGISARRRSALTGDRQATE
jgi:peptidoglycan/xylan/chitin deacetylase (PgdA/CDA1 family)